MWKKIMAIKSSVPEKNIFWWGLWFNLIPLFISIGMFFAGSTYLALEIFNVAIMGMFVVLVWLMPH